MANKRVDCDGHVMEVTDELISFVGEPFKTTGHMNPRRVLPSLDRFHTPRLEERKPGTFDPSVGPEKWIQFLDKTGLESSVLSWRCSRSTHCIGHESNRNDTRTSNPHSTPNPKKIQSNFSALPLLCHNQTAMRK
jgi:hypothetical protein